MSRKSATGRGDSKYKDRTSGCLAHGKEVSMRGTEAITKEELVYQSWSFTHITAPKPHGVCLPC